MFPGRFFYFRELVRMNTPAEKSPGADAPDDVHRQLVVALEKARTRFAVAMASEGKMALLRHWKRYVETDRRIRHFLQTLRCGEQRQYRHRRRWESVLEMLRRLPAGDPAASHGITGQINDRLCEALTSLEQVDISEGLDTHPPNLEQPHAITAILQARK